ncbi:MAG TPA: hypothetical protein VFK06_25245 [Candidatus Angelobacter sp.]|nr:hypothetical protein [Candidatus Angelobacter sp.]
MISIEQQAAAETLAEHWRNSISDPVPEPSIWQNWLKRYDIKIMHHAVHQTIQGYNRGGMTYEHALRYCASVARRTLEDKNVSRVQRQRCAVT